MLLNLKQMLLNLKQMLLNLKQMLLNLKQMLLNSFENFQGLLKKINFKSDFQIIKKHFIFMKYWPAV